jgi:hypothetical protein
MEIHSQNKKDELIQNIKRWVELDSQIKQTNDKIKYFREEKTKLTSNILTNISENSPKLTRVQLADGELKFYTKKEYSPLTFGFLEKCLKEIITDQSQVSYIIEYVKNKREVTNDIDIKRLYSKESNK